MKKFDAQAIEKTIGYSFNYKSLLKQAFIRKSYTDEVGQGENNEVLEFLGDKVLDIIVTKKLVEQTTRLAPVDPTLMIKHDARLLCYEEPGSLSKTRSSLVNKEGLAYCIEELGLHEYLIMSFSDHILNVLSVSTVKEDLFEAIIGAVAIDCEWNMEIISDVVDNMLNFEEKVQDGCLVYESYNFKQRVQAWCQRKHKKLPEYEFVDYENLDKLGIAVVEDSNFTCRIILPEVNDKIFGYGKSKAEASADAAEKAYIYLQKNDMLVNLKDIIGEPCIEKSINQLQELYQKKYISKPEYDIYDEIDNDGSSIWYCRCKIECTGELRFGTYECKDYNTGSSTKVEAKKIAAYEVLCWLFKCLNIEIESLKYSKSPNFYYIDQEIEYEDFDTDSYDFNEDE